jgi:hypothetical protein
MKRVFAVLALCASVTALAACGGSSSEVSAATYVKSACTAAATWKNAIITAGQKLEFGLRGASLPQTKANYVQFVQALENATGHAANQLAGAGTPSVSGGKPIASMIVRIFSKAKTDLGHDVSEAESIPTTSKSAFNTAANRVQNDVRNSLAQMSAISPANNPPLRSAAAKDTTCRNLASGA